MVQPDERAADLGNGGLPFMSSAGSRSSAARPRHLICIAASAGGLQAMLRLFKHLPADLDAAVVVSQHLPPWYRSHLPAILSRVSRLPFTTALDGEVLRRAHAYVAPPGYHHVVVSQGRIRFRPQGRDMRRGVSADPLFVSSAEDFGPDSIGVVLSGSNRNGAAGVSAIRAAGGRAVAQAPEDAAYAAMPRAAIEAGVDFSGTAEDVARYLVALCREP